MGVFYTQPLPCGGKTWAYNYTSTETTVIISDFSTPQTTQAPSKSGGF